jgi:hypothetical protein
MALILKPNQSYNTPTGAVCSTAYLRCNPFDRNDKDTKIQVFYAQIFNSHTDKTKQPLETKQININGDEYDTWFSPLALENDKNLQDRAYHFLLDKAKKYSDELAEFDSLSPEQARDFKFQYSEFAWLQGDIWVSDEV